MRFRVRLLRARAVYVGTPPRYILRMSSAPKALLFALGFLTLVSAAQEMPAQDEDSTRAPSADEVCAVSDAAPPRIEKITFTGLQRTRRSVLLRAIDAEPGTIYTEEVRQEIRRDLRRLGLFDRVRVKPDPSVVTTDRTVVEVELRERWTLVPIPFFTTASGGTSGGLFVIESNLLGYNKQLITGGAYGTAGFNGLLVYSDPAILGSSYLGSLSLSLGRSEEEALSLDEELLAEWESDYTRGRARLGYRFSDFFTASTFFSVQQERFRNDRLPAGATETESILYHGGSIRYADQEPLRYFDGGYAVELEGEYELGAATEREWGVVADFSHNIALFQDHRLRYALHAQESDRALWRVTRLGGRETQRTVPRESVPSERYVSGGLTYEFPLFRPDWGTLTLLGFYEAGALLETSEGYHGPGAGFRVYVSRVTLPALGLDLAYSGTENAWLFSFSIGMSM